MMLPAAHHHPVPNEAGTSWLQVRRPFDAYFPNICPEGGLWDEGGLIRTLVRSALAFPLSFLCARLAILLGKMHIVFFVLHSLVERFGSFLVPRSSGHRHVVRYATMSLHLPCYP